MRIISGEDTLALMIKLEKLPAPEREFLFDKHMQRKWRFDFAYPDKHVAIEVEGGVFINGRHSRGKGFTEDCVKYNAATEQGWKVYRYTTEQVENRQAIEQLKRVLGNANC